MTGRIFNIQRSSFVDGPGIRTVVFFKGCNMRCKWCHNPESWLFEKQMMVYKDKCTNCGKCHEICQSPNHCVLCGKCELVCPNDARKICGKDYTVSEIFDEIIKDVPFYQTSGGGVTFSGGECMLQLAFLLEILKLCYMNGIHTAVDTAGNVPWDNFEKIMPYTNLFLYDIKCITPIKHREFTESDNALILSNFRELLRQKAAVWVRVPSIPGFNSEKSETQKIEAFLKEYPPLKTEFLQNHTLGENKYAALNLEISHIVI